MLLFVIYFVKFHRRHFRHHNIMPVDLPSIFVQTGLAETKTDLLKTNHSFQQVFVI